MNNNIQRKLVILDRDGVINQESEAYIKSAEEWIPLPHSLEAIALLKKNDYQIAVATNQSGLAKGLYNLDALDAMHAKMQSLLEPLQAKIDAIFFCPHNAKDDCECRKPKPGLLDQIANHFQIDFTKQNIYFIGDSLRDLEAALAAGCKPILVLTGYGPKTLNNLPAHLKGTPTYSNLYQAVQGLLENDLTQSIRNHHTDTHADS